MAARMVAESDAGALAGVYSEIRSRLGLVPNVFKAMAAVSHDVLVQNWTAFRETVLEGILPRVLKEMIGLVVARDLGGDYAVGLHTFSLHALGVGQGVIRCLLESGDCPAIPYVDRMVLGFARAYTRDPDHTPSDSLEALGLSDEQAQEVIDAVLIFAGISRFAGECALPADG
jgi:alkylhydroperoxidase/carboxymuconolactone decarboxylase family protein YurZ